MAVRGVKVLEEKNMSPLVAQMEVTEEKVAQS
ncbi:UNVERIFIED_CONTAM: hypothetical protein GTU68_005723 [Idotea baltica]|nr:hypothetical protein [Idotea baltica]